MVEDIDPLGEMELANGLEKKKLSGKKLVMIVGGAIVAFVVVMGVMSMMGGDDSSQKPVDHVQDNGVDAKLDQMAEEHRETEQLEQDLPAEKLELLFIEIPEMLVNLNTGGSGTSFLKIRINLEIDRESYKSDLGAKMPRILDDFQVYLRELRPDDLTGSAGIFRLKEELLSRINQSVAPTRVKDVLFAEFIVQGQ